MKMDDNSAQPIETLFWGTKNQPEVFQTEVFSWTSARHVRAKMLVFQDLEDLTEVFGRMSAGTSGRKLPLWADFAFLVFSKVSHILRAMWTTASGLTPEYCGKRPQEQ